MRDRKLTRAERRRQLRDERKEPGAPLEDTLDADDIAAISHTVGRLAGFIDGYIIGKVGISSYQDEAIQEMVALLPEPHCEDSECYPCRLGMEAVGYFMQAENDEEAYRIGRETVIENKPSEQIVERQRTTTEPPRLRMEPLPEDC